MYGFGVLLAILAGTAYNLGNVLQKKAVDSLPRSLERRAFYAALLRRPLWLAGFLVQVLLGTTSLLLAQLFIGPALIPGLMATGLIALTVGSVLLVGERPAAGELVGIALLIVAVGLLGLSRLTIELARYDLYGRDLLWRTALFTGAGAALALALEVLRRRRPREGGLLPALGAGCLLAVSNYWTALLAGAAAQLLHPPLAWREAALFLVAALVLLAANALAIHLTQAAFRRGRASRVVPIQQLPIQLAPVAVYLFVFGLRPPTPLSLALLAAAVVLILAGTVLLGRRQALEGVPGR